MASKDRDTFLLKAGHYKMFRNRFSLEQKGHLLDAIFCDRLGEDYSQHLCDEMVGMAFDMMREFYLQCDETYRLRAETNRANANKRYTKDANGCDCVQTDAIADSGSDLDYKSKSISKSKSKSKSNSQREYIEKVASAPSLSKFIKPSIDEIAAYAASLNYVGFQASAFFDFYESKGWKVGSQPMKDWRAAVRNWQRKRNEEARPRSFLYDELHPIGDFSNERTNI